MVRLLIIVLFLFMGGCNSPEAPVKIGVVLPLSGDFKIYGSQGLQGIRLAVEEINASGGVLGGRPIELLVRDNQTSPSETVRLGRELIQIDNVFALFGPVSSNARNALLEVAEQHRVPLLYGIDYEGGSYSRYLFCYSLIPDHYVNPVVPYMQKMYGDRFYIFGYDYIWPHQIAKAIIKQVDQGEGEVTGREFTPFGILDYQPVLMRIEESGADNLMLILPGAVGFRFLQQFSRYPFSRPIKIMAFAADENYLAAVPEASLEGVLTALNFFSSYQAPASSGFVDKFQGRFGTDNVPTYAAKAHYDLMKLLSGAINATEELSRERVIDGMVGQALYLDEERVYLREDHHFDLPMYIAEFSRGNLSVIKDFGVISPADQRLRERKE